MRLPVSVFRCFGRFKEFWGLGGHLGVFEGVLGVWSVAPSESLY